MMFSYSVKTIPPLIYDRHCLYGWTLNVLLTTRRVSLGVVPVQNRSKPSSVRIR